MFFFKVSLVYFPLIFLCPDAIFCYPWQTIFTPKRIKPKNKIQEKGKWRGKLRTIFSAKLTLLIHCMNGSAGKSLPSTNLTSTEKQLLWEFSNQFPGRLPSHAVVSATIKKLWLASRGCQTGYLKKFSGLPWFVAENKIFLPMLNKLKIAFSPCLYYFRDLAFQLLCDLCTHS